MNSDPDLLPSASVRPRRRWLGGLIACWLLALAGLDTKLPPPGSPPEEIDLAIDSSVDSITEVFFDVGEGFNEKSSASAHIAPGPTQQLLTFPMPARSVRAIRIDPLTIPGTVHLHAVALRRTSDQQTLAMYDPATVSALNQIARLTPQPDGVEIVTTPDSNDSSVLLPIGQSIEAGATLYERAVYYSGVDISATILALLAAGVIYWTWPLLRPRVIRGAWPVLWLDRRFASWAAALSRPEIVRLDRWVFWFLGGCALFFGALAAAGLHGSSLDEYSSTYPWSGRGDTPLLGHAREIRSDEWALQTPVFLNQVYRQKTLEAESTAFGQKHAALLINVPCRDFTQIFRPEFWPFHVLPITWAFPVYWQAKGFVLLTGMFVLLLLLTRGHSGLSALGASWMCFSPHMQWGWSWPSLLPEMIGFFGWTICLTLYLTVGRNRYLLAAASAACAVAALDFALCFYPPHQIPMVLFGALLVPVWLWHHRAHVFRRDLRHRHFLALAACWVVVALVLLGFYLETRDALIEASHTVYPGKRVSAGGDIPLEEFFSHFLDFWKRDDRFPALERNICEATGFLWLLPVTLLLLGQRRPGGPGFSGSILAVCWTTAAIIAGWMMLPIPASVGHWLLLDHVPPVRCLPGLGLINVVGVIVYLALPRGGEPVPDGRPGFALGATAAAVWLGALALLFQMNTIYQHFFRPYEVVLGAAYLSALVLFLLARQRVVFAVALLVPLVFSFDLVNPVEHGLSVVTRSRLFKTVQGDPHLRDGGWLVYSNDFTMTGFVVATGVNVFNAFKVIPDLKAMAAFDPAGQSISSYNQSGHMVLRALPPGQPSRFQNPDVGLLLWSVSPVDPALRQVGVRFLVFDQPPDPALVPGLKRIAADVPEMWIYELP